MLSRSLKFLSSIVLFEAWPGAMRPCRAAFRFLFGIFQATAVFVIFPVGDLVGLAVQFVVGSEQNRNGTGPEVVHATGKAVDLLKR